MTLGLEFDFKKYSWSTYQSAMNAAMVVVGALLFGLFLRVQTGRTATWYAILERLIAVGFLGVAALCIFILPVTLEAIKIYAVWYGIQVLFMLVLPGKTIYGLPLKDGKTRLKYNCNGLAAFIFTWILFFGGAYLRFFKLSILWDNFVPLLNVVNIWSFIMTAYLYIRGTFSKDRVSTGNPIEDWWYGLELNPRIGNFDLKFFSESRPGLILWVAINFSIAAAQYEKIKTINVPMIFVCIFQFIYVFDYFILEEYIVSTIDIIHERFGWMLVWGDYVWVPFFYVQQAMYLYYFPRENSLTFNIICIVAFIFGYCVFRFSNRQKHKFKENPHGLIWGKPAKVIETKRGSKLLISGWWGLARHINYLGDLLLAFSWGLPVGFESYIPYLYLAFMTGLLLHRFARDDKKCKDKYEEDWDKYCAAVPYKLIPYIW